MEHYELSRDYYKQPLKYGEKPPYEDVYKCMCDYCLPKEEIAKLFNVIPSRVNKWCKFYKIKRTKEQINKIREMTNIKKYGVPTVSAVKEFQDKAKQTSLERYGVTNVNKLQSTRDKIKKTNLERYGVEHAAQSQEIKQKLIDSCMEKYGVPSKNMLPEKIQKCKDTNLEKYGNTCSLHGKEIKEKTRQTFLEKYGVEWAMQSPEIIAKSKETFKKNHGCTNISNIHISKEVVEIIDNKEKFYEFLNTHPNKTVRELADILGFSYDGVLKRINKYNLRHMVINYTTVAENILKQLYPQFYKTRSVISPYEIDLYNDIIHLGIEYNGTYWHSTYLKDKYYHQQKSKLAKQAGVFLYHIFEYEWNDLRKQQIILSQLNNLIGLNTQKIGARKCQIGLVGFKQCEQFLRDNHIQGSDRSSIRLGLYYLNELVSIMTFCVPRFNKNYQYELSRFCCKLDTNVIGGASKLFKYFREQYNPKSIITYSDCAKTRGNLYPTLGFKFLRQTEPNYVWVKNGGGQVLSRYQCQKHKLEEYTQYGNTEIEIMTNRDYFQIFDCGNYVWEYINKE